MKVDMRKSEDWKDGRYSALYSALYWRERGGMVGIAVVLTRFQVV